MFPDTSENQIEHMHKRMDNDLIRIWLPGWENATKSAQEASFFCRILSILSGFFM